MENTLLMRTEASHSLNFLIYIQNLFLNQNENRDELKFPYIPTKIEFREDFDTCYRMLWEEVLKRITEHPKNDLKMYIEKKNLFYHGLFAETENTLNGFNQLYQAFKVWWDSLAGRFSVERSIDDQGQKIYAALADLLIEERITPKKELNIILIYDDCVLVDLEPSSYLAVLSISDCLMKYKELIRKLQLSID
ncbi:hypothetical protein [Bacillus suaedae]|uniref:Group-specific protein n=1 Tax=Halalkalibacter suaedae TaxID=2822140 RepID=A0A941APJ4_9BACI|nr:hypothetical protein [Bacillus suaedae]MBP3951866.1 hypothetical protein [Bacillus suaedae]